MAHHHASHEAGKHISLVASSKPDLLSVEELGHLPKFLFGGQPPSAEYTRVHLVAGPVPEPAVDPKAAQYDSDVAAGFQTVYVVGLNDNDKVKSAEVYANVQDFLTYLTGLTNSKIAEKIKSKAIAADAYSIQSDYRARLMTALVLNTNGFIALDADVGFTHNFSCKTVELHTEILTALFKGLAVPTQIFAAFEGVFSSLKDTVVKFSTSTTVDSKHIFLVVKSFVKNDLNVVETKLRFFLFKLNDKVREITVGKSSYKSVDIEIEFQSTQYTWNDKVYQGVKAKMDETLKKAGEATMANLPNVDVDI